MHLQDCNRIKNLELEILYISDINNRILWRKGEFHADLTLLQEMPMRENDERTRDRKRRTKRETQYTKTFPVARGTRGRKGGRNKMARRIESLP